MEKRAFDIAPLRDLQAASWLENNFDAKGGMAFKF
jgi:hypothetical protein